MHDLITRNLERALTVLTTGDANVARQAAETKGQIRELERRSHKRHLKRLHEGVADGHNSSAAQLDVLDA